MALPDLKLSVNGTDIPLDKFTIGFVSSVVKGMLGTLRGVEGARETTFSISDDKVNIELDGVPLPLNPFVNDIFRNTLEGAISSLRGVGEIENLKLSIIE